MIISVAPMMDLTDRHDRYFLRLIAPDVRLYTEMITTQALLFGNRNYLLQYHPIEHPLALQLGGCDPHQLSVCAKMGEEAGYKEINLNVGCPSPRVAKAKFGACLMLEPTLVAECVYAMQKNIHIPVTVKCRIGVDHQDSYEALQQFISKITEAGCETFIIHARKAWLSGLSPKENREIPPLDYDIVAKIKKNFPHLTIILNGGLKSVADIQSVAQYHMDGVMIGRAAYYQPYLLAELQQYYFQTNLPARRTIIENFIPYVHEQLQNKIKLISLTRHILGLYHGLPGAAMWRRTLSQAPRDAGVEVIDAALKHVLQ